MNVSASRQLLVPRAWMQAVLVVFLFGFFVLGFLAFRTYEGEPPIPVEVVEPTGKALFSGSDIMRGQEIFLRNGLMEYGSIFGHGAYLGPDYTADYLHRAALIVREMSSAQGSDRAAAATIEEFKTNRYDPVERKLTYTTAQATAFYKLKAYYADFFGEPTTRFGLRPNAIKDSDQIRQLTAFFSWSAWASLFLYKQLAAGAACR